MEIQRLIYILPPAVEIFVILWALTGCTCLSVFIVVCLVATLCAFSLPRIEKSISQKVLDGNLEPIAHRGAGIDAPENTISAIREAKKNGAAAVEFDLEWTQDGVPVILHDDTVDRTTDGHGAISLMSYASTQQLDAAAKHRKREMYVGEKIPTLEETVQVCISLGMKMYIDVKSNGQKTAEVLSNLCKKYPKMYDLAIVCSFYPNIIYSIRKKEPHLVTGLTFRKWYFSKETVYGPPRSTMIWKHSLSILADVMYEWALFSWIWYVVGNSAFLYVKDSVSRTTVEYFKNRDMYLVLWTVNDPIEKKYFGDCLKVPYMTDTLLN